jgi:tetratricopeptide (TPR) repeat protein
MRVGAGRKRLGFIVRFLEIWFSKDELSKQFEKIRIEILTHILGGDFDKAENYLDKFWYIKECLPAKKSKASEIINIHQELKKLRDALEVSFKDYADTEKQNLMNFCWLTLLASVFTKRKMTDSAKGSFKKAISYIPDTENKKVYFEHYLLILKVNFENNKVSKDDELPFLKVFLNEAVESGNEDLVEFLSPFATLVKYLETKDPEIIDRLRHEERIIIDDMLKMLGEKVDEKPKRIKQKKIKMLAH